MIYPANFIGPLAPGDSRAPAGFIGPTLPSTGNPNAVNAATAQQQNNTQSSGGGGGTSNPNAEFDYLKQIDRNPAQENQYQQMLQMQREAQQNSNNGYDEYLKQLDNQMGGLNDQRGYQTNLVSSAQEQGLNSAKLMYDQNVQDAQFNRDKSLRGLGDNLAQSWKQGNAYLGARGAGDSSAANQYAYALAKVGAQQRGDYQSQYDQNMTKLKTTYDTEIKNLEAQKNDKLMQISQWFSEAQNSLAGQKGQLAVQKSQQALSIAMQMAQQIQQQVASQQAALQTWAMNHSTNLGQLQQNLGAISGQQFSLPGSFAISGAPKAAPAVGAGYGAPTTQRKDIFGRPIPNY